MPIYDIAGLKVKMDNCSGRTKKQAAAYLSQDQNRNQKIDIDISIDKKRVEAQAKAHPGLSRDDWEYMLSGTAFYKGVLKFSGILLHSSCVVVDGVAYAFSADSGTGKSTHTELWLKKFGVRAYMLNDDKPCIRKIDGRIYACGTPWSGKYDYSAPEIVPLGGICFLERSKSNHIQPADKNSAIFNILAQTVRRLDESEMNKLLDILEDILGSVPLYELSCNISQEAADLSYNTMKKTADELK